VEVSDTGFDDASCFFRQENSAAYLTGSLNTNYQVTRSGYSSPITDKTRRKVVQYLMRDTSNSDYAQDYASGHGSHCAGTVAGYIPNDGSAQDPDDDYYNNCVDYIAYCDTWFAPGGDYAGTCDTTCGIAPTDAYSGMAPGAKLMVYDFGDSAGALSVPTDMENEVYKPAYDQGARITSNSWGSGAPYNYYDAQAINIDQYVYDKDDVLVLFAAGNDGGGSTDDIYEDGDATIGGPAVCKNVLTVGAAETTYTPDTVASFSSRGPTPDMRLKPEVCGPGNPVTSAKASGSAGLASCAATTKSGTSMATPAVAGTAALIREILIEGKHEYFSSTGYASSSYSESAPSAALLKALLIGSTVPLTYGYDTSGSTVTLSNFYSASSAVADSTAYALGTTGVDFTQGFGHVRLSNIFSVDGSFDTFCYEDSLAEYSTWTSEFEVSSTASEVAITLVWTDPPGSQYCGYTSSVTCLIHDLDLKVNNDGTRLYSNFGAGDGDYSGQEDTLNNAEKVTIATSDLTVGTTITVTVETNGLSYADTQKFAVVVAGNIGATGTSPVPVPTMKPTQPIPTPTSYPVSIPIPSPTRTPIPVPTKLPNPNPTFEPTPQPNQFPNPTPHPTSLRPSFFPTESPVRGPSFNPTGVPTKLPSKMPTSVPTMFPTSLDTVTIITSFDLTSSAVPTSSDEVSLKSTLANELDVSETSIKDFSLTYTTSRRVRRHLLTTYTWTAAFEVSVSLASTSSTTSDELATSVSSTITSSSFTSSVATSTGATVDTASVSTVVVTRSPTMNPTKAPKKKNKKTKSAFESSTGLNAASLGGMAVGALLLIIGCGCFIKYTFCQKHYDQFSDEGHGTHEMGTSHVKKGNYLFSSSSPPPPPPPTNVWVSETTSPKTMNKNPSFTIHDILENQPAQKRRSTDL
jgi:hypothetical protein